MSDTPEHDSDGQPSETGGDLKEIDHVMLAALSTRRRTAEILSSDQERLLDAWVGGTLPLAEIDAAEELVRRNILAVERVLERRLVAAASDGPPVPPALEARVRASFPIVVPRRAFLRWPSFNLLHWSGLAGAMATALIVAIIGVNHFRDRFQGAAPIQVAMATLGDRNVLFEASDVRMRGAQSANRELSPRFRDVELPTNVVQQLAAIAGGRSVVPVPTEFRNILLSSKEGDSEPISISLDAALLDKLATVGSRDRMSIRIYDLQDPRSADVRNNLPSLSATSKRFFLTFKP